MSRRRRNIKREITPDPVYHDTTVAQFINKLMFDGKKSLSQKVLYSALKEFGKKVSDKDKELLDIFKQSIENCKPALEVRSRRVGGATYQVPVEVRPSRRLALAIRWIIKYSRERGEKTMILRLASEFFDAYNNRGHSIKKKEDVHRMAEANKAFSHYNW